MTKPFVPQTRWTPRGSCWEARRRDPGRHSRDFLDDYFAECEEHLTGVRGLLLALEGSIGRADINRAVLDELFRHFHSLKGISGMVEVRQAEVLAHRLEDYLRVLRNRGRDPQHRGHGCALRRHADARAGGQRAALRRNVPGDRARRRADRAAGPRHARGGECRRRAGGRRSAGRVSGAAVALHLRAVAGSRRPRHPRRHRPRAPGRGRRDSRRGPARAPPTARSRSTSFARPPSTRRPSRSGAPTASRSSALEAAPRRPVRSRSTRPKPDIAPPGAASRTSSASIWRGSTI